MAISVKGEGQSSQSNRRGSTEQPGKGLRSQDTADGRKDGNDYASDCKSQKNFSHLRWVPLREEELLVGREQLEFYLM